MTGENGKERENSQSIWTEQNFNPYRRCCSESGRGESVGLMWMAEVDDVGEHSFLGEDANDAAGEWEL
jgi:hypothetical protein